MEALEAIQARYSVRKFTDEPVSDDDLTTMLRAATLAPNSSNRQGWHFIVVRNRDVIRRMKEEIQTQARELASFAEEKGMQEEAEELHRGVTSFVNFAGAPVTIAVCERLDPLDGRGRLLLAKGLSDAEIDRMRPSRMLQSIGAAIENLMITAVNLGYGTCYMLGPLNAVKQVEEILGIKPPYRLVAVVPIGRPAQSQPERKRRPLEEVVTIID